MRSPRVTVIGLGPGGPDLITAGATEAIAAASRSYVRTMRHPTAFLVNDSISFDALYDEAETLEDVYVAIVEELISAAERLGDVLYAVPGSPRVAERSVELLESDPRVASGRVELMVLPALSFLDLAWVRLGVDPLAVGVRVIDGHNFASQAAGQRGPLLVAQCDDSAVLSDVKLAFGDDPPSSAWVLHHLGLDDESIAQVSWGDLDRMSNPDHLTSIWIPELAAPVAAEIVDLMEVVRTLRERCPWDREQTHSSLTRYLIEECYELVEAIEQLDESDAGGWEHLEEELGDVLFQVMFHATLGAEEGQFSLADVARTTTEKLVRRHPHVFAGLEVSGTDEIARNWEQIKQVEKGRSGPMEGIPSNLPSLLYAHKVQRKAQGAGVDVSVPAQIDVGDLKDDEAVGAALFLLVAAARRAKVDPESALRATAMRFRDEVTMSDNTGNINNSR